MKTKTKNIKFPALVIQEAKNLRKFATKEEIEKLSISKLEPTSEFKCVYGLMTGNCFTDRATELITNCCSRVYSKGDGTDTILTAKINGSPKKKEFRSQFWSPIEVFIYKKKKNKEALKKLVDFIKGKRVKLN